MMYPFLSSVEAQTLAMEIVNTIPDPFLVLDSEFRVIAASRSFYDTFELDAEHARSRTLYDLGDGRWNIPALRLLLETIIPEHVGMDGFEVEQDVPGLGLRVMLLNARQVVSPEGERSTILLAFKDVTASRAIAREKQKLLEKSETLLSQNRVLLQEIQHRVGNSLQIISGILLMKARAVASDESRGHLEDAYKRVMSVALVQSHLNECEGMSEIEVGAFLVKLCDSLVSSMSDDSHPIKIQVLADECFVGSSMVANLGLIVTELVINAVKYAFPDSVRSPKIFVAYELQDSAWRLMISDNGVGKAKHAGRSNGGLGTMIVDALVKQLGAEMVVVSGLGGVSVSIKSPTFEAPVIRAA